MDDQTVVMLADLSVASMVAPMVALKDDSMAAKKAASMVALMVE